MTALTDDIYYLTVPVDSADHAVSLAQHLTEGGVPAGVDGGDAVTCTLLSPEDMVRVHRLRQEWSALWAGIEPGLRGLPVYIKPAGYGE